MTLDCVIGAGGNEGDRLRTLRSGVSALGSQARITAVSPLYETEPVGGPPQADHLNAAVRLEWNSTPEALLEVLQQLEARFGRTRAVRWGPRTLDLDLLWIDGLALASERLTVPHPRLHERAFALVPLLDVAPDARHPETGKPLSELLPWARGEVRRLDAVSLGDASENLEILVRSRDAGL